MEKKWSKFWKSSSQRRKQRKYVHNAPLHIKRNMLSAHLSDELSKQYGVRNLRLRKGDTVKILRGDSKGKSGKVSKVSISRMRVYVEDAGVLRADGTKSLYPIHASNLMITKLSLSDAKRVEKIDKVKRN